MVKPQQQRQVGALSTPQSSKKGKRRQRPLSAVDQFYSQYDDTAYDLYFRPRKHPSWWSHCSGTTALIVCVIGLFVFLFVILPILIFVPDIRQVILQPLVFTSVQSIIEGSRKNTTDTLLRVAVSVVLGTVTFIVAGYRLFGIGTLALIKRTAVPHAKNDDIIPNIAEADTGKTDQPPILTPTILLEDGNEASANHRSILSTVTSESRKEPHGDLKLLKCLAEQVLPKQVASSYPFWKRLYSLCNDGDDFDHMFSKVNEEKQTLFVLQVLPVQSVDDDETTEPLVIGAYSDTPWEAASHRSKFHGGPNTCLFRLHKGSADDGKIQSYKWTGKNRYFQLCDRRKQRFVFGCTGNDEKDVNDPSTESRSSFGLCIGDNFQRGTTHKCQTFDNEPLVQSHSFEILNMEVYGFRVLR